MAKVGSIKCSATGIKYKMLRLCKEVNYGHGDNSSNGTKHSLYSSSTKKL